MAENLNCINEYANLVTLSNFTGNDWPLLGMKNMFLVQLTHFDGQVRTKKEVSSS